MNPASSHPNPPPPSVQTVRKLIIDVVDARDLLPKDGQGSSSPYVVVDFDGQKKRTSTKYRDLNPTWNESIEFEVSDPEHMDSEELEIEVFNDKRYGANSGSGRKNHFLGRVKLYGSQFAKRGEEGLFYVPLEKKSVFSWIRGEIGLRIYYFDQQVVAEEAPAQGGGGGGGQPPQNQPPPEEPVPNQERPRQVMVVEEARVFEVPAPMENVHDGCHSPPVVVIGESHPQHHHHYPQQPPLQPQAVHYHHSENLPPQQQQHHEDSHSHQHPPPPEEQFLPSVRKMQMGRVGSSGGGERVRVLRRPNGDYSPRVISGKFGADQGERVHPYGLVEPMQYLFVRILKARGLAHNESPAVDPTLAGYQKGSRIADPVLDRMNQGLPCLKLQVKMKKY